MKPALRTFLRTLTRRSSEEDTQITTYCIPAQISPDIDHPPPRVQPRLPSSPFFHGRDHFTTDQLLLHQLERSKRAILRKQIEQDPAYPDISPCAGYWGPSQTPFITDFPAAKRCENWRQEKVAVLKLEDLEDQARRDRMEKRLVRSLEPEFTRGVDKEEFASNMEMKFGWRYGHAGMTGVVGDGRGSNFILKKDEDLGCVGKVLERPVTPWPSAESMFMATELNALTVSSLENHPPSKSFEQISAVPKPLRVSKFSHYKVGKVVNLETQQERLQHAAAQKDFSARRLMPERDPFADKTYPRPGYTSPSASTEFGSFREAIGQEQQWEERKRPDPLFISRKVDPHGPSLYAPFSWPEVVEGRSSFSSRKFMPPKPLSGSSFQNISKEAANIYDLSHSVVRNHVPLPQSTTGERNSREFEIIERMPSLPSVAVIAGRQPSFENQTRVSKSRNERSSKGEKLSGAKDNRGVGSWLKKLW